MEAPPVIGKHAIRPVWWAGGVVVSLAAVTILFRFNPVENVFYPRCTLYVATGLYCPGCGGLRAMHSLLHGEFLAALHFNPLVVISLPVLGLAALHLLRHENSGQYPPLLQLRAGWIKLLLAVILVFTVARNLPFAPFSFLSPP